MREGRDHAGIAVGERRRKTTPKKRKQEVTKKGGQIKDDMNGTKNPLMKRRCRQFTEKMEEAERKASKARN